MDNTLFISNIEAACKAKGLKPTPACREAGVGYNFLTDLKRGQIPSVAKVQQLAEYLGVTTSDLLGEEKPPESEDNGRSAPAGGVCEETRVAMELVSQLNPENRASAIDYLLFQIAKQKEAEGKK